MAKDSKSTFTDLSAYAKSEFNSLILLQCEHLNKALDKASADLLSTNNISEELLARAMLDYSGDPKIDWLISNLNNFEATQKMTVTAAQMYEIMQWRTFRAARLKESIAVQNPEEKLKVLTVILADEVHAKFGFEEEELSWTFNNTYCESQEEIQQF
jgi:hypothetical protein